MPLSPLHLVVSGSSSGIGLALCERLVKHGHYVWGLARSDQSKTVARLGPNFRASQCDVSNWPALQAIAQEIAAQWPALDGLITSAGVQGEIGRALECDPIRWSTTVRNNLDGTYYALRAFAPALKNTNRRAKIVCFSGGGATKPRPNFSAYGVAKTGIVRLIETIAEEEADTPLDINAIAPGAIYTRLTEEVIALGPDSVGESEYRAALKQKNEGSAPLQRALDLVEWLLSPASDGISGRLLSAPWDPWPNLHRHTNELNHSDIYTLRRILPEERGKSFPA